MGLTSTKPLDDPFAVFGTKPAVKASPSPLPVTQVSKTEEGLDDPFAVFATPADTSTTKEGVLSNTEDMAALRKMMVASKDTYYNTASDEEVYDDFMSHMRWMNTNEVFTAKEAYDVMSADDETKAAYGAAYKVYDKVDSIFSNGGDFGDKAGAVFDYGAAIVTSPSTWAGFLVGRIAGRALSKVAIETLKTATTTAATAIAAKGGSKAVQLTAKKEVVRAALKVNSKIATATALAIEAPLASIQDSLYQDIMMETGVQEEFSYMQNAVSTLLGGSAAITSHLANKTLRGVSGLEGTEAKIVEGTKKRAARATKAVAEDLKSSITKANTDWLKLVEEGRGLENNQALEDSINKWFTDYKTDTGFISILQRNGAELDIESSGGFARSLVDFAEGIDGEAREAINEAFSPLGVTFDQVTRIFAATANKRGYQGQELSVASRFYQDYKNISVANRTAAEGIVAAGEEADKLVKDTMDTNTLGWVQSVWKRMVVSHPGTTALNVKGWSFAMAGRTLAETVQMSALYGSAGVKALMGDASAGKTLGQANALMKNLSYMTKMAVDPFITIEAFYKLLEKAPKKIQGEVKQQFFQGVDNRSAASFGLNADSFAVKNTEKLVSAAQTISLVNAQDIFTKSFSGIKELDKQARLTHGIGLEKLLNERRAHEITDDMWQKAVNALQEDTFSVDFRGGKTGLAHIASISQELSSNKYIGFIYPFGQFVNSIMAFGVRYSPLGLMPIAAKLRKEGGSMEMGTRVAQAFVGTTAIAIAAQRERGKQEEGLQWNEERDSTGAVYKVDNLFPWGLYNLAGRIYNHQADGEGMSADLMTALAQQMSFPAALGDLSSPKVVGDLIKYMTDESIPTEEKNAYMDILGYASESISGIAAGFTRPLDPLNDFVGALSEAEGLTNDVTIDRKQSEGVEATIQNFGRYTNSFFNLLLGTEDEDGRKLFGKPKFSATQEGPVRSGNVGAGVFGSQYVQRRTPIDQLLGMVDKAPFKADSFTTGNAAYDDFMNRNINPVLERNAVQVMNSPAFKAMSKAQKINTVDKMLTSSRAEILAGLESGVVGGENEVLLNERRKLLVLDSADLISAKKDLGITTPDHKLNLTQIELIKDQIKVSKELFKNNFDF